MSSLTVFDPHWPSLILVDAPWSSLTPFNPCWFFLTLFNPFRSSMSLPEPLWPSLSIPSFPVHLYRFLFLTDLNSFLFSTVFPSFFPPDPKNPSKSQFLKHSDEIPHNSTTADRCSKQDCETLKTSSRTVTDSQENDWMRW